MPTVPAPELVVEDVLIVRSVKSDVAVAEVAMVNAFSRFVMIVEVEILPYATFPLRVAVLDTVNCEVEARVDTAK